MGKLFFVYITEILLFVLVFTQVIVPIFVKKLPFFWFFRKEPKAEPAKVIPIDSLEQRAEKVSEDRKEIKEDVKNAQDKINSINQKLDDNV